MDNEELTINIECRVTKNFLMNKILFIQKTILIMNYELNWRKLTTL